MLLGPSATLLCLFTGGCVRLAPQSHSQTDSGSSSLSLFIIDQGDGCLPRGLRCGNFFFSSPLLLLVLSFSPSLPPFSFSFCFSLSLFAQHLNALVQTLFSPAGRAVPYAHPVKAAVVMDTGKHQKIKQSLECARSSVTLYQKTFFSPSLTPHLSSVSTRRNTCECIALFIFYFIFFYLFLLGFWEA